jgi:hypothetical protein
MYPLHRNKAYNHGILLWIEIPYHNNTRISNGYNNSCKNYPEHTNLLDARKLHNILMETIQE